MFLLASDCCYTGSRRVLGGTCDFRGMSGLHVKLQVGELSILDTRSQTHLHSAASVAGEESAPGGKLQSD